MGSYMYARFCMVSWSETQSRLVPNTVCEQQGDCLSVKGENDWIAVSMAPSQSVFIHYFLLLSSNNRQQINHFYAKAQPCTCFFRQDTLKRGPFILRESNEQNGVMKAINYYRYSMKFQKSSPEM